MIMIDAEKVLAELREEDWEKARAEVNVYGTHNQRDFMYFRYGLARAMKIIEDAVREADS